MTLESRRRPGAAPQLPPAVNSVGVSHAYYNRSEAERGKGYSMARAASAIRPIHGLKSAP